jgi:phosphatidate phosphatase APP1
LVEPAPDEHSPVKVIAQILVPSPRAKFGIISDVDDTIMVTNARHLMKMAFATFLRNARGRVPFPGVGALYKALQQGGSGADENPVFYVSSGPWNLYDLLQDFLELNSIPVGPVLLQDFGFEPGRFLMASHLEHKMAEIERILQTFPELPFVLMGDSGQHDPEVYRKVLERVPNRIKAIYIRDVTDQERDEEVRKLAEQVKEHAGTLLLVQSSAEAGEDAFGRGLISAANLELVRAERTLDEKAPDAAAEAGPLEEE